MRGKGRLKQLAGSRSSDWLISGRTALATTQARINTSAQDKAVSGKKY